MFDADRFLSGDRDYVREIIREYSPLVLVICQSYARDYDHAQDLYQETWKAVWAKGNTFRGAGSFQAWLHKVATNTCVSDFRTRKAEKQGLVRYITASQGIEGAWAAVDPLAQTEQRELHRAIHRVLPELSDGEREALVLRVIDERSAQEAANVMGVTPATVRSHVRHAMNRLRRIMEDPDSELSRYRTNH